MSTELAGVKDEASDDIKLRDVPAHPVCRPLALAISVLAILNQGSAQGQTATLLSVDPAIQTVQVGDTFETSIMIDDVEGLQGADIDISYDPDKVSYVSHANGDVLPSDFSPFRYVPMAFVTTSLCA